MKTLTGSGDLIVGCTASFANISTVHPLYTLRACLMAGKPVGRLYHGFRANLTCDQANVVVNFAMMGFIGRKFHEVMGRKMESDESALAGAASGIVSSISLTSLERVMIIQQLRAKKTDHFYRESSNMRSTYRELFQIEGPKALTRGLLPTMGREMINAACFFGLAKALEPKVSRLILGDKPDPTLIEKANAAGIAFFLGGAFSGAMTAPFDLIKTRVQKQIGREPVLIRNVISELVQQIRNNPEMKYTLAKAAMARSAMIGSSATVMGLVAYHLMPHVLPVRFYEDS